jgi:hypothetical protein
MIGEYQFIVLKAAGFRVVRVQAKAVDDSQIDQV